MGSRYHAAGVTRIRLHRFTKPRVCDRIIGCDRVGKGHTLWKLARRGAHLYRVAESRNLVWECRGPWTAVDEVWGNASVLPDQTDPSRRITYSACTGRKRGDREKLVSACSAQKLLLYAPLSPWYAENGVVIKDVHRATGYQATNIFTWLALLAELFKLLGKSAYGKLIEALERQTCVVYAKDEKR